MRFHFFDDAGAVNFDINLAKAEPVDVRYSFPLIRIASEEEHVAGAYGHSRLGEWMFDGVTAEVLADCPVPYILFH